MAKKAFNYQNYFVNKAKLINAKKAAAQSKKDDRSLERACAQGDLETMPLAAICAGIQLLMNELIKRGKPIKDFDNKKKAVALIQIIGGEVYFLAKEQGDEEQGTQTDSGV